MCGSASRNGARAHNPALAASPAAAANGLPSLLIGSRQIDPPLVLAPMAGVTDRPFRQLCRRMGAGYAVAEMTSANPELWNTPKSRRRRDHAGEQAPIGAQIAGADPLQLAAAAQFNVEQGAEIIDINMGCPAKKVCNAWAGSALLQDEALVERILRAVVGAVDVPVTLKIRTGWRRDARNGLTVARIAEDCGIAALAVHGRTRDMHYGGEAEYETIAAIKRCVAIPVIANGDIDTPRKARDVLRATGADGLMIGRAAQGNPWVFRQIRSYLTTGVLSAAPSVDEVRETLLGHLRALHCFYGELSGVRIARKHIGWYAKGRPGGDAFRRLVNGAETAAEQLRLTSRYLDTLATDGTGGRGVAAVAA